MSNNEAPTLRRVHALVAAYAETVLHPSEFADDAFVEMLEEASTDPGGSLTALLVMMHSEAPQVMTERGVVEMRRRAVRFAVKEAGA